MNLYRNTRELCLDLSYCSINDHSLCGLMGELSKHAEASREGVLHRVTELNISFNKIGDNGIACIVTVRSDHKHTMYNYHSRNQILQGHHNYGER